MTLEQLMQACVDAVTAGVDPQSPVHVTVYRVPVVTTHNNGEDFLECSNGEYVRYEDMQAMRQVLLDLIAAYDLPGPQSFYDMAAAIERARELTK